MIEEWREVDVGIGIVKVSSLGRVSSIDREVAQVSRWGHDVTRKLKGKILTPTDNGNGYKIIGIVQKGTAKKRNFYVHRLVAQAFLGLTPESVLEVNHINRDKGDNRLVNLELVTSHENKLHWKTQSRYNHDGYYSKYSPEDVNSALLSFGCVLDPRKCRVGDFERAFPGIYEILAHQNRLSEIPRKKKFKRRNPQRRYETTN